MPTPDLNQGQIEVKNKISAIKNFAQVSNSEKKLKIKNKNINLILNEEKKYKLTSINTYKKFFKTINKYKINLINKI